VTTYVPFTPTPSGPFQFNPTLDGQVYRVNVTWNLFDQGWYVNVYQLSGPLVVALPLIGSDAPAQLVTLSWSLFPNGGQVAAQAEGTLVFTPGSVVDLTVSGTTPVGYNGTFPCLVTGVNTFTYPLADDPGALMTPGYYGTDISLAAGYFTTSTLVYREPASQFEVNP